MTVCETEIVELLLGACEKDQRITARGLDRLAERIGHEDAGQFWTRRRIAMTLIAIEDIRKAEHPIQTLVDAWFAPFYARLMEKGPKQPGIRIARNRSRLHSFAKKKRLTL